MTSRLKPALGALFAAGALMLCLGGLRIAAENSKEHETKWGVYEMLTWHHAWEESLDQTLAVLGGGPDYVLFFRDLSPRRGFPRRQVERAKARGMTAIVSLELSEWGRESDGNYLERVARGEFDDFFRRWASEARDCGQRVVLRFGFEMNGDWFPWGSQPEAFIAAWRRCHDLFEELEADTVEWMFSPNVLWQGRNEEDDLYRYYPGDDYVDLVGLDGYNFGDKHSRWHSWQRYEEVFERTIRACAKFDKPLYLSEIGCADDPRKAEWMRDFLRRVSRDSRVEGFIYFNHNNPRKGEPNWRLDSDSETLEVFKKWAQQVASSKANRLEIQE